MTEAVIKNIKIAGISTVIGNIVEHIDDLSHLYEDLNKIDKLKTAIGLNQIQKVDNNTTSLDLCLTASKKLINDMGINTEDIDGLIFVTQTPDHYLPSNATIVHRKLSLKENCACFDVNQGCSGYVYGLWLASSIMLSSTTKNILLLAGDTMTRAVNKSDKSCRPLFGDSGTCTLLSKDSECSDSYFTLNTDGSGNESIIIPAGGFRNPNSSRTKIEKEDNDNNVKSMENLHMDGSRVLNFAIKRVPQSVERVLTFSGFTDKDIDYYLFHQPNKFVIEKIIKKLRINGIKVPRETVGKYGNQGPSSIPSTISDAISTVVQRNKKKLLLCGFGTGFSWASAILDLDKIYCAKPMRYEDNATE